MFNTIATFLQSHKKALKRTAAIVIAAVVVFFFLALGAMHGAAHLFNRAVAKQDMLRGTITVETLAPSITGRVSFTELVWKDPEGHVILYVPDGSFTVRPWDIVTRSIKSTTITDLTLNDATIATYFDDNMQMDIIAKTPEEKKKEDGHKKKPKSFQERVRNINWNGQRLHASINLNNCRFEVNHMSRHYVMTSVNAHIGINTGKKIDIKFSTGAFDGTAIGDGVAIQGKIDMTQKMPVMDMNIDIVNVDPSSLGLGDNVHDQMTLTFHATGPLDYPTVEGKLKMDRLNLPALRFTNVAGGVHYENSLLTFSDVTANVYGGKLAAWGDYNLETRAYHIYGEGTDLNSSTALRDMKFRTLVHVKVALECDGNRRHMRAYGAFESGSGYYFPVHFNSISGRFNNRFHELDFFDVVISTAMGDISTDALHIVDGDVQLSPIRFRDPVSGETTILHGLDEYKNQGETQAQINQDLKAMQGSVKSIKNSMKSMSDSLKSWRKTS